MPTHSPIGSCCSTPRFNGVGGVDFGARTRSRWTPWKTRIPRICNAAAHVLVSRAHWIGSVAVRLSAPLKNKCSI